MKKITLLLGMAIATTFGFSQIIVDITSAPSCTNLEGIYNHEWASNDGTVSGWGASPNMFVGANAIVDGEMVLVDDGTSAGVNDSYGNPTIQNACDSATWTQDLTGKVAVLFRGDCEFGLKIFNAQKRGAIAVIVINHTGDAIAMGGGTYGPNVTIPAVMVSEVDGDAIAACLGNGGTMEVFIGSKVGLYANDMGTGAADIVMPESAANPLELSQDSSEFNMDLGLWAYNIGQNDMNGVTVTAEIEYMGNVIHSVTSAPVNFNQPDTSFVDTQYIDLGNYGRNPAWLTGKYTLTYTLNTPVTDDETTDNIASSEFYVTADNVYSKCRIDGANDPIHTVAYSLNESTTQYDNFETCIQFRSANASRLDAKGITFSCEPVGQTMAFQSVGIRMYEWNDVFTDANDPAFPTAGGPGPWNVNEVGSSSYLYFDETEDGVNKYLAFDQGSINLNDNQRYLFCVFNDSDSLRIGFDAQIDYTTTVDNYLEYSSPVKDLPNGGSDEWYAAGFGLDVSTAITVKFDVSTGITTNTEETVALPYPNPVANLLTVPVRKNVKGNVIVEVYDLTGKLVLTQNKVIGTEKLQINVASIANGSYVFKTTFADGTTDQFKVSVNR
ncbi:MAG: T9SS type A sorting domain-containing protein [Flavobacteriales bacterium]|nr:T9SS type A sorting domain-containing protein [Flavobacteriales bacterium]MCB9363086.1 T9SS type A sorting domain-containing protein [Flavobacteriales bacterium]